MPGDLLRIGFASALLPRKRCNRLAGGRRVLT
jgi:hypothetical protein